MITPATQKNARTTSATFRRVFRPWISGLEPWARSAPCRGQGRFRPGGRCRAWASDVGDNGWV